MSNPPAFSDPDRIGSSNYWCDLRRQRRRPLQQRCAEQGCLPDHRWRLFQRQDGDRAGHHQAAKIFYEAQTHLLTSASDYQDLYSGLQQACTDLVGTSGIAAADCQQVKNAVDAVEMNSQPASCAVNESPF